MTPEPKTIPDSGTAIDRVFEQIARRMPDAVALQSDGCEAVGYAELDQRANRFARFLHAQNVSAGDAVGVLAGRSVGTIIALLGILKAGAIYVPLDASDPRERRDRILADSAPVLIVTDAPTPIDDRAGRRAFDLEQALSLSEREADTPLGRPTRPDDLACVMYTSGSTGQPKGVLVPHRAVLRLVRNQTYAPFGPAETTLHLAPLAFDASTFEIWGALLNAGSVAVVTEARPSLDAIVAAIGRHGVTVAWFTAGLFSILVDQRLEGLRPLRCIVAGGDVLSPNHVKRAYAGLPDCRIVNGYGPTENTTFTCCYPVPREGWGHGSVPIGFPIAETRIHLLDEQLTPVAEGSLGQIACAGEGLAAGYLGNESLTAQKFVWIDTGAKTHERVYLTGDLGRQRSDGAFEFCGRLDTQVKIRGKRVEIGEIESALRGDPAILDAVVVARDARPDGRRLDAYLILRDTLLSDQDRATRALTRLRGLLPDYMIPGDAQVVAAFPLTPNGKVDRARLPDVARAVPRPCRQTDKSSGLEDAVAALWARALSQTDVDREANFFDLGGSSLTLMALHAALRSTLAPHLPLMAVFEHTSVRSLARYLEASGLTRPAPDETPMPAQARPAMSGGLQGAISP